MLLGLACLLLLARATESWLGGFYCMFPGLVARFVDWIRPDSAIGAVFSLAAPVRVQLYFFSLYLTFLFLVTWLRALGTSRKKNPVSLLSPVLTASASMGFGLFLVVRFLTPPDFWLPTWSHQARSDMNKGRRRLPVYNPDCLPKTVSQPASIKA